VVACCEYDDEHLASVKHRLFRDYHSVYSLHKGDCSPLRSWITGGKEILCCCLVLNSNVVLSVMKFSSYYHISGTQSGTVLRHVLDQLQKRN